MLALRQIVGTRPPGRGVPALCRLRHLVFNWLVFIVCYPLANHLAQRARVSRDFAIGLDAAIPFVPWMIIPYASAGLLFTLAFFVMRTPEQLRALSRRLSLTTVTGTIFFVLVPGRFTSVHPPATAGLSALLFEGLALVDAPYNQLPSLHVAYCLILWAALRPLCSGGARILLGGWLLLVGASTVFTWQHHLADVGAGLLLGAASGLTVRHGDTRRHAVAFHYALAAGLTLAGALAWRSWLLADIAASLSLVALMYRARRADCLFKRAGGHPLSAWLLYWPYLAGYRLTWALVLLRERGRPALANLAPGVWTGRRLTTAEACRLPADCHVIDLCAELPEVRALRGRRYRYLPLLDLQAPRPSQLRAVLAALERHRHAGEPVYVHCAMGYSRSRLIARLHTRKHSTWRSPSTN